MTEAKRAARKPYGTVRKLERLPEGSKVQKRPTLRRQPPSSSKIRIIYISSKTPFMAAVNRIRKTLDRSGKAHANNAAAHKQQSLATRIANLERSVGRKDDSGEGGDGDGTRKAEVIFAGTGKAIGMVLELASWFEAQGDCDVQVKTGTVGVVDDVVDEDGEEEGSRVRRTSKLEVTVKLK